mmetsp:Transcript_8439/g.21543  ORF Transcript_8439/g.21543 Transcript_8439/m.21543 type:complete len:185 (+) Transcript_8439:175-729(+)
MSQRRRVSEAGPSSTQPLYRPIVQAPRIPRFILAADLDQATAPLAGWVRVALSPKKPGRDARPRAHIDIPRALWETVTSLGAGGTGGRKLASNDKSEQEAFWCRLKDGKSPFSTAATRKALAGQLNSGNENESPRTRGARRARVCGPGTAAAAASNSTHAAVLVDKLVAAAATMEPSPRESSSS